MQVAMTGLYAKGPDGQKCGPKLKDVFRVDGEKVGYMDRRNDAHLEVVVPRSRYGQSEWREIMRQVAQLRADEGDYTPSARYCCGAPTDEQMAEALERVNQELDDEEGDDDE